MDTLRLALYDSRLLPIDWLSILTKNIQTSAEAVSTVEARKMGVTPALFRYSTWCLGSTFLVLSYYQLLAIVLSQKIGRTLKVEIQQYGQTKIGRRKFSAC